jgi:HEAT repeat protein
VRCDLNTTALLRILSLPFLFVLSLGSIARADQSQFVNAKLETRPVGQSLHSTVSQIVSVSQQPTWIAYEVPAIAGDHSYCCGNYYDGVAATCGTCNLEDQHSTTVESNSKKTIQLEKSAKLAVLLRVDQNHVMRVRALSSDCTLDAASLPVIWLTGVQPEESVTLLTQFVTAQSSDGFNGDSLPQQALMVIAQHGNASADRALDSFVAPNQPPALRERAAFWLGASRGKPGLSILEKMANSDPSSDLRAKVTFAIFVSHEPQAIDDLIRLARDDSDAHVRSQALFWLAQKAGQKASSVVEGAIQNDPDTEVKKKAVFALSQMPDNEGVPKLIDVARNNKNPEVRKQAMFWLGQSKDSRALAFFQKVLSQ